MKKGKMSQKEIDAAKEGHAAYVRHWRNKAHKESTETKELRLLLRESIRKDKEGSK